MDFDFEDCGIETISKARLEELTIYFTTRNRREYGRKEGATNFIVKKQFIVDFIINTNNEFHNEDESADFVYELVETMKVYRMSQEWLDLVTPEFYIYLSADDEDKAFIIFA